MNVIAYFRCLAARLFRRDQTGRDLADELRSHIDFRADVLERGGLTRAEAERRARVEFGGAERFKQECCESLGGNFLDVLVQDGRFSLRTLHLASNPFCAMPYETLTTISPSAPCDQ